MWGCYFSIKMAHMGVEWPEWKVWTIVKCLAALSASWLPLRTALFKDFNFHRVLGMHLVHGASLQPSGALTRQSQSVVISDSHQLKRGLCLHYNQLNSKETPEKDFPSCKNESAWRNPPPTSFGICKALCEDRVCGSHQLAAPLDDKAERWSGPGSQMAPQGLRASPERLAGLQATGLQKTWMWPSY